ncbi:MAG TPA: nucleotidyltransferase domain-containing protein, partial [Micromonospora sp.]
MTEEQLRELARRITAVPGIVGVLLGGSRARGDHTLESDVDLGLYYRPPLDVATLTALARQVAGPDATLTEPGGWGPWVDGGGWLRIDGTAVDWIYRDVDRVRRSRDDARAGRYRFHAQVGHPLGVPDFAYAGEVALGVPLADPSGELAALRADLRDYPPALSAALVEGLWEASFAVDLARKGAARGDTTYVAGCLFRAFGLCAHALHGHAGRWLVNEKGAVAAAGRLPGAPADFAGRAQRIMGSLGGTPVELRSALDAAAELVADTAAACRPASSSGGRAGRRPRPGDAPVPGQARPA